MRIPAATEHGELAAYHIEHLEWRDPNPKMKRAAMADERYRELLDYDPPLASDHLTLSDLHPWLAWLPTANDTFAGDVAPAYAVRLYGVGAHAGKHHPAWVWDSMLREAGVDPRGDFDTMAARAAAFLREYVTRVG